MLPSQRYGKLHPLDRRATKRFLQSNTCGLYAPRCLPFIDPVDTPHTSLTLSMSHTLRHNSRRFFLKRSNSLFVKLPPPHHSPRQTSPSMRAEYLRSREITNPFPLLLSPRNSLQYTFPLISFFLRLLFLSSSSSASSSLSVSNAVEEASSSSERSIERYFNHSFSVPAADVFEVLLR